MTGSSTDKFASKMSDAQASALSAKANKEFGVKGPMSDAEAEKLRKDARKAFGETVSEDKTLGAGVRNKNAMQLQSMMGVQQPRAQGMTLQDAEMDALRRKAEYLEMANRLAFAQPNATQVTAARDAGGPPPPAPLPADLAQTRAALAAPAAVGPEAPRAPYALPTPEEQAQREQYMMSRGVR